jgi:DNA-binding transcriptional MocR family regulator
VNIEIDRDSTVPLYVQISQGIREMILSGALPEGFRLPPERRLARALGVNRSTVLTAYHELKADDLVDAHVGRGTVVLPRQFAGVAGAVQPPPWRQLLRDWPGRFEDPLVRDLLALSGRGDVANLSVGLPSPELLPVATLRGVVEGLIAELGGGLLLHSPTEGVTSFREALCELATARGFPCNQPEVVVTSGSQQALDLLARVLVAPGDDVVVEAPSFFGALQVFRAAQARLLSVPVDRDGMRTDILQSVLERHRPKLIYTLPTFQNPSGAVMSLARRQQLLELAQRFQVPIVEDDPYGELRYEGESLPSLKALDRHGYVIYVSSFSKVLFPGLRVGWVVAARPLVRQLVLAKQVVDLHTSTPGQLIIERLLRTGLYARHLTTVRQAYRESRDVMDESLRHHAPTGVTWQVPAGGFYLWCRMPEPLPAAELLARAAALRVAYLPGSACFAEESAEECVRLNFTYPDREEIRVGVRALMTAVRQVGSEHTTTARREAGTRPIV